MWLHHDIYIICSYVWVMSRQNRCHLVHFNPFEVETQIFQVNQVNSIAITKHKEHSMSTDLDHTKGTVSNTCAISMLGKDRKYKHIFTFSDIKEWQRPIPSISMGIVGQARCGAVIMHPTFCKIFTIEDEIWGECCDSNIWFIFCHCCRSVVCNVVIN